MAAKKAMAILKAGASREIFSETSEQLQKTMQALRAANKTDTTARTIIVGYDRGMPQDSFNFLNTKDLASILKKARKKHAEARSERRSIKPYTKSVTYKGESIVFTYESLRRIPVRKEAGFFMHFKKRQSAKRCFTTKTPQTSDNHIGIELEICTKLDSGKLAVLFTGQNLQDHVTIKDDGSLRAKKGHFAYEVTVLMKEDEYKSVVERLCVILNSPVVDAYVNETCGYHLHLDMRSRDVKASYRKLYKAQKFLIETQPPCRLETTFVNKNEHSDFESQKRAGGRYWVINPEAYSKFKTLEIRSHSGTTDRLKIVSWIELCLGIVNGTDSETAAPFVKLSTLQERAQLTDELIDYLKQRMEKFKKYFNDNENTDINVVRMGSSRGGFQKELLTIEEARAINTSSLSSEFGTGMGNTSVM
jgi:hypothetical protein